MRNIESATIWARDLEKAQKLSAELSLRLGFSVTASDSIETATAEADIIVTATPSAQPLLKAEHIKAGQHITAMGADAEHKNEIDPQIIAQVRYFCDRLGQVQALGELHHAIENSLVSPNHQFPELGQVISEQARGRDNRDEITLCDLTGTGIQDTAIATLAFQLCQQQQAGTNFKK